MREFRDDAVGTITRDKCKGNLPVRQDVGNGIGLFATQVHVEDTGAQIVAFCREDGVAAKAKNYIIANSVFFRSVISMLPG